MELRNDQGHLRYPSAPVIPHQEHVPILVRDGVQHATHGEKVFELLFGYTNLKDLYSGPDKFYCPVLR